MGARKPIVEGGCSIRNVLTVPLLVRLLLLLLFALRLIREHLA